MRSVPPKLWPISHEQRTDWTVGSNFRGQYISWWRFKEGTYKLVYKGSHNASEIKLLYFKIIASSFKIVPQFFTTNFCFAITVYLMWMSLTSSADTMPLCLGQWWVTAELSWPYYYVSAWAALQGASSRTMQAEPPALCPVFLFNASLSFLSKTRWN